MFFKKKNEYQAAIRMAGNSPQIAEFTRPEDHRLSADRRFQWRSWDVRTYPQDLPESSRVSDSDLLTVCGCDSDLRIKR